MKNSKFKEIIIALLLCLAILLVLALLLYNYVPSTKTLPEKVAYKTQQNVRDELVAASDLEEDQIILTYEVDGNDMNNYENINSYNPGNANPFAVFEEDEHGNIIGVDGNTGTSSGTSENSGTAGSAGPVAGGSSSSAGASSSDASGIVNSGGTSSGTFGGTNAGTANSGDTAGGGSAFYHDKGGK